MAKSRGIQDQIVSKTNSKKRPMENSTCRALVLYVSQEKWLQSILDGSWTKDTKDDYFIEEEEDLSQIKFEDDIAYLRSLDPKEWKEQDHYAVLGIKNLRHKASEDIIKRAYKYKILKHHPDKRKALGEDIRANDDYFTCITRAWETLSSLARRRSYDSVDPYFNDDLPDEKEAKERFFEVMGKAFKDNARWSVKKPVPKLGSFYTPKEKVERFYSFWYDFESWREYSYEDEEDKESGQDRDVRKWIEKKNKATRAKRKKEEMIRIRTMVDMAYALDPRIKLFQQQEKDRKNAAKRARQEAFRARQEEERRVAYEAAEKARLEKEKQESEAKAKAEALKQERDAIKKALRKARKSLRDLCKENKYFAECPKETIRHMEGVEKLCELMKSTQLEESVKKLRSDGKEAFLNLISEVDSRIEAERRVGLPNNDAKISLEKCRKSVGTPWSEDELQLLIKAVNLFPAGTVQRWEVVANFVNQHNNSATENSKRDAKDVLAKAKDLQSTDFGKSSLKDHANKKAFDNFIAEKKAKEPVEERMPAVTERLDSPIVNGTQDEEKDKKDAQTWTPAEQKLLEQALKTYPSSVADRWDQIAACLPFRTKKECMKRYKELVELVKAKKAATSLK